MYFVNKVLKGVEQCYHMIKTLALEVIVTKKKLKPCFLGHPIIINTNYPIKQVLKKPNLAGKFVAWSIELFEMT